MKRPLLLVVALAACGCHSPPHGVGEPAPPQTSYRGAIGCDEPRVPDVDGACVLPGIADCASPFRAADGTCRPRSSMCPAGSIPAFAVGCSAVGVASCAPMFIGGDGVCRATSESCPKGTYPVPSEGCVPYDRGACPAGKYPDAGDASFVIHVDASSKTGSPDGSEAAPFAKISAAVGNAPPGATLLIAAGKYAESVAITIPLELRGACPSQVIVGAPAPSSPTDQNPAFHVIDTPGVSIRGMSIVSSRLAIWVEQAEVDISDVRLSNTDAVAIVVGGYKSSVRLDHVAVEDTAPGVLHLGHALELSEAAHVSAAHCAFLRSHDLTMLAADAETTLSLSDVTLDGVLPNKETTAYAVAIEIDGGATGAIDGSYVGGTSGDAVRATGAGTRVTLSTSVIEDTDVNPATGFGGSAVSVEAGAAVSIGASALLRSHMVGVLASGRRASATVSGTLVADTSAASDGGGWAVALSSGARATVETSALLRNAIGGVVAESAKVGIQQVLVEAMPNPTTSAVALYVRGKAVVDVADCAFWASAFAGVYSDDPKATVHLRTSLIAGTRPDPTSGLWGFGVWGFYPTLTVDGCEIADSVTAGIVGSFANLSVTSTLVRDVAPGSYTSISAANTPPPPEPGGDGVVVAGGHGTIGNTVVLRAARAGILAAGPQYYEAGNADISGTTVASSRLGLAVTPNMVVTIGTDNTFDVVREASLSAP